MAMTEPFTLLEGRCLFSQSAQNSDDPKTYLPIASIVCSSDDADTRKRPE